jgi:hypothetical protein
MTAAARRPPPRAMTAAARRPPLRAMTVVVAATRRRAP